MKVKVKLFATLRTGRFEISELEINDTASVHDILKLLDIDEKDAAIIFINGIHGLPGSILSAGDELAIFPPIGGG